MRAQQKGPEAFRGTVRIRMFLRGAGQAAKLRATQVLFGSRSLWLRFA